MRESVDQIIRLLSDFQLTDDIDSRHKYSVALDLINAVGLLVTPTLREFYKIDLESEEAPLKPSSDEVRIRIQTARIKAKRILQDTMSWAMVDDKQRGLGSTMQTVFDAITLVEHGEAAPIFDVNADDPRKPKKRPFSDRELNLAALRNAAAESGQTLDQMKRFKRENQATWLEFQGQLQAVLESVPVSR
jgi:hypothetical protein